MKKYSNAVMLGLVLMALAAASQAATPQLINYQGRLTNAGGSAVPDGVYSVIFTIYDQATGGTSKWAETTGVQTSSGNFSKELGTFQPILDTVFNNNARYLGIKVGADPEMTPRTRLESVPYADRVSSVDGSTGGSITGNIYLDASSLTSGNIYKNNSLFIHTFGGNLFVGEDAGNQTTTGNSNTAMGSEGLQQNTSGSYNAACGLSTLRLNTTGSFNTAVGEFSLEDNSGGSENTAVGESALTHNTIGSSNTATGFDALYLNTTGQLNTVSGWQAMYDNTTGQSNTAIGDHALLNDISGSFNVAIGENALVGDTTGGGNTAVGEGALAGNTIGVHNTALGDGADVSNGAVTNATAIGANAVVNTDNSMVFGDGNVIRWGFGNNPAFGHALEVGSNLGNGNAAYLTTGGVWVNTSDRNAKEGITLVDGNSLLQKVNQLPVYRWNYKGEDPSHKHVGPMAQDFYAVFGLGDDNKHISTIDPAGVALASIQALTLKVNQQEAKNDATQAENKMLRSELEDLRKQVNQLLAQSKQDGTAKYSQK